MATSSPRSITSTITNHASKASPISIPSSPRPQLRGARAGQELGLKKIIGTTTTSSNAFDALPEARTVGYIAGAVAVVAKVENDGTLSQKFYKARQAAPTNGAYGIPLGELSLNPLSPSQGVRSRIPARNRDSPSSPSSFGSSSGFGSLDSPGSKSGSSILDKVKPLTGLAFSPDGRFLAVGETGHKPRVLIFSLAQTAYGEPPWTTISEHTFAVRCLAYSPDSQFLATLGDINDGFLYIWSIHPKTGSYVLRASNKCITNITSMAWIGNNLITVGTRHIKVWNVEATFAQDSLSRSLADQLSTLGVDGPRTLLGRNCLLGDLLDKTFTAIVPVTANKAIVCSDLGDICLFDENSSNSNIVWVGDTGFHVHTATLLSSSLLLIAGHEGNLRLLGIDKLIAAPITSDMKLYETGVKIKVGQTADTIVAMGYLGENLVILDSQKQIQILSCNPDASKLVESNQKAIHCLPAHGMPPISIYAVRNSAASGTAAISWTADGTVLFWDTNGCCQKRVKVMLEHGPSTSEDLINELRVVRITKSSAFLVSGDKFGILRSVQGAEYQGASIFANILSESPESKMKKAWQNAKLITARSLISPSEKPSLRPE
jgi:WD40 repeat protein